MPSAYLAVSGPTGCGKTRLAAALAKYRGTSLVPEPSPIQLLRQFSRAPARVCYELQRRIAIGRLIALVESPPARLVVFDRTLEEDSKVFFLMHYRSHFLTSRQFRLLRALVRRVAPMIPSPAAWVYVVGEAQLIANRLQRSGAPLPIRLSLASQLRLYRQWRSTLRAPVVDIDVTARSLADMATIAEWIHRTVPNVIRGRRVREGPFGLKWVNL